MGLLMAVSFSEKPISGHFILLKFSEHPMSIHPTLRKFLRLQTPFIQPSEIF